MAKRTRNSASEQTFLKHTFQHDSGSQSGYKQLKYEDTNTLPADDNTHEYSRQNHSSPTLATLSAAVANSSSSPVNKTHSSYSVLNGQVYRNVSNSYMPNGTLSTHVSPQQVPYHGVMQPTGTGSVGAGHFASNISTATHTPNITGSKKTLLDLSRHSAPQTSPQASTNESQLAYLLSTPKANPVTLIDPTLVCSNLGCNGIRELLASLALMCILSLLMAFLALFFLQRSCQFAFLNDETNTASVNNSKSPKSAAHMINSQFNQKIVANAKEYVRVFQISVSLSTLTIALDLCCLFVCCIQFLSIVKLIKTPFGKKRSLEFIKKTSHIRVLSIGAFLVSIPIFFTGVILYTFVNFDEIPALITSVIIGIGIIFCGVASVQNVYLWQWEKTKASQDMQLSQQQTLRGEQHNHGHHQLMYNNGHTYPLELSTLV